MGGGEQIVKGNEEVGMEGECPSSAEFPAGYETKILKENEFGVYFGTTRGTELIAKGPYIFKAKFQARSYFI